MMQARLLFFLLCALFLKSGPAWGQAPKASQALQASNILNPNLSAVGWIQAELGKRKLQAGEEEPNVFQFKEVELAVQSVVDPYARADFFVAVTEEGEVELEEGTIDWFALPYDLGLKAGKFRMNFGKFNRTHPPETPFADRPLVHERYFGEEGLSGVGGSLSWHVPNPFLFVDLTAEAVNMPEAAETPAFDTARRRLLYLGRLSGYYDLTEDANVTLGASYANGAAGEEFDPVVLSSHTLKSELYGLDLTFKWKNPRRAIYRSLLWQTEVLGNRRETARGAFMSSLGLFSHLEYQFARRWRLGGRWDWSELPNDNSKHESGGLAYLTFTPSEFSLVSLQGKRLEREDGRREDLLFLKVTLSIGPHGAHPF